MYGNMVGGTLLSRHPDPYIKEGGRSPKKLFSALRVSVWSKNKGGTWAPRPPPLDPPLLTSVGSVAMTCTVHSSCANFVKIGGISSLKIHLITLAY